MTPELNFDLDTTVDFLVGLLDTPSPTGYYEEAIAYTEKAFAALNIPDFSLVVTAKGALVGTWRGESASAPRGMTAHVDTLGLMVKEIKSNGRLKTTMLGGYDWNAIEFEGVTIQTADGRRYRGTVVPVNASFHVNRDIPKVTRSAETLEVRLDARTTNAEETRGLGIGVGDFIFLDPRVETGEAGFIRSRHLDDKAGVAAIYAALIAMKAAGLRPVQDTTILIANYEEVGHGGANGFPPGLAELVAIDMGALGDGQTGDEFSVSICAKDSSGPYHPLMMRKLRRLSDAHNIPYKVDIYPYYGSDGSAYWRAGGEARVGLIGPGVDASHAYERTHRESIEHTAHLIARWLLD
ncbi:MAG: M42 family metallopeptidase [Anaerolineaceae bacterium]|nr:M42 family metallopeptidase [Anaerolineaceae bacterium]